MYFVLESGRQQVRLCCSIRDGYEHCVPVLEFLHENAKTKQYSASSKGFKPLFTRYAEHGRNGLTAELFHEVNPKNEIWEFVKGDLRIFCFKDENHVVLTHGCIKKSQKVDQRQITIAVEAKKAYFKK